MTAVYFGSLCGAKAGTVSPLALQQLKKREINVTENVDETIAFFD